jgi:hypothetical protein
MDGDSCVSRLRRDRDPEAGAVMKSPKPCAKHCFCRSKTVPVDPFGVKTKRVRFCCFCGHERGSGS